MENTAHLYVENGKSKRKSKTFSTHREATAWAYAKEVKRDKAVRRKVTDHTLLDAICKYSNEVSPTKKGKRWEQIRLAAFKKDNLPLNTPLHKVQSSDIAKLRDNRLKKVSNGTVNRELTLLSSVFSGGRLRDCCASLAMTHAKHGQKQPLKPLASPPYLLYAQVCAQGK